MEKETKELLKTLEETVANKTVELSEAMDAKLKDVTDELETLKASQKAAVAVTDDSYKEKIVNIVKAVVIDEEKFESAKEKVLNSSIAWEGAETVFDQFEKDILQVINEESLLNEVKIVNITGDTYHMPKYTNGVTTSFVSEQAWAAASEGTTTYITINLKEAASRLDITEKLLKNNMTTPDMYDVIIRDIWESQSNFLVNQVLNGDGTGDNFTGVLVDANVNEIVLAATKTSVKDLGDSDITDIVTKAKRKFKKNKKGLGFVFSEYVAGVIMNIRTTTGMYLYPEMREDTPKLRGRKVTLSDLAPVQDASEDLPGTSFLIFGDFKYFTLVQNWGLAIDSGYVNENFNKSIKTIRAKREIGWGITYSEAFTKATTAAA